MGFSINNSFGSSIYSICGSSNSTLDRQNLVFLNQENRLIDRNLANESTKASRVFRYAGLGAGTAGTGLIVGSGFIAGGALAVGVLSAGVGLAVVGAIFLLIALDKYLCSRSADDRRSIIDQNIRLPSSFDIRKQSEIDPDEMDFGDSPEIDNSPENSVSSSTLGSVWDSTDIIDPTFR